MSWFRRVLKAFLGLLACLLRRCVPIYDPVGWNDANGIQYRNNCYNYACNQKTNTYAQPGRASGNIYSTINCSEVGDGARSDGLVVTNCDIGCGCLKCCHRVALVIAPGYDFHWYRQDRTGRWSHKPGGTEVTDLDNSGNPITDPRTADRGPYIEFCGCYCVCRGRVTIN